MMSNKKETCFYCDVEVVIVNDDLHSKTSNAKSIDHFFPKNHPLCNSKNKVVSCRQCNLTKGSGDPIEFIIALRNTPLPEWRAKEKTKRWYKITGYNSTKYKQKND